MGNLAGEYTMKGEYGVLSLTESTFKGNINIDASGNINGTRFDRSSVDQRLVHGFAFENPGTYELLMVSAKDDGMPGNVFYKATLDKKSLELLRFEQHTGVAPQKRLTRNTVYEVFTEYRKLSLATSAQLLKD